MTSFWDSFLKNNDVEIVKNDRYKLAYRELDKLKAGITVLNPMKKTRGHSHEGVEEVYFFISGNGFICLGNELHEVKAGDMVLIPDGMFHQVINDTEEKMEFVVAFNKSEGN